jgi:hypothetical protein
MMAMVFSMGMVTHAISATLVFDFIGADQGSTYAVPNPPDPQQILLDGDGVSDSWGIGQVLSIYKTNPVTFFWLPGTYGYGALEFYMGGLDDWSVRWTGTEFEVLSTAIPEGAKIYMYGSQVQDINYAPGPGGSDPLAAHPTAGWNVGNLNDVRLLELEFVPGIIPGDPKTVLAATFNGLWGHGEGAGYLEVVPGSLALWNDMFDLNGYLGGNADFYFEYSADEDLGMGYTPFGWTVEVDGTANSVPIPSALLLLGSGIIGLLGIARRRFYDYDYTAQ